jgi:hypothetical protein
VNREEVTSIEFDENSVMTKGNMWMKAQLTEKWNGKEQSD